MLLSALNNFTPLDLYFKEGVLSLVGKASNPFFSALQLFDSDYALEVLRKRDPGFFVDNAFKNYKILERYVYKEIPVYKEFAKEEVQYIDKSNYLSKYPLSELLPSNMYDYIKMISVSSGSSGKPYFWPRSQYLELETTIIYELLMKDIFKIDAKSSLLIDAYSMGMYVAGVFTLNAGLRIAMRGYPLSVITPGISIESILRIVKEIGSNYDQIILAGYPPFVKDIIEEGLNQGINWRAHNLKFIFGAEAISEDWREYLYKEAMVDDYYRSSFNTYGSADAAILGHETPFSILIKRIAHSNPNLLERLFDGRTVSTFVQYHPQLKYFTSLKNELVCSTVGGLPLLNYNLHDDGRIYKFDEIVKIMEEGGVDILKEASDLGFEVWRLPFIVLFGKSDQTITLYGLNIYPQTIRKELEDLELAKQITARMTMYTKYDLKRDQYIEIEVELQKGVSPSEDLKQLITERIYKALLAFNFEYKTLVEKIGPDKARPRITLKAYGLISEDRGSKQKWIRSVQN